MSARTRLPLATWNVGNGTPDDAARIITKNQPAALALQEASDQDKLVNDVCGAFGYLPIRPDDEPGMAATPLLYDPEQLQLIRLLIRLMVPGQKVGKGTGPDRMKTKWLVGGYFEHTTSRRHIAIASTHRVAGNAHGTREDLAIDHARAVDKVLGGYGGAAVVLGDWNSIATDNSLAPLRRHGWISDQVLDRVNTHGRWAPDHAWWRKRRRNGDVDDRLAYVGHRTMRGTSSDHRPLIVEFDVLPRGRR